MTDEETLNPEQGPGGDVERVAAQLLCGSAFAHTKPNPTKQGPGGDVERVAAQLFYDSAFAVMVHNRGTQDSEIVREVLERERGREEERGERMVFGRNNVLHFFFLNAFTSLLLLHR